MKMLGNRVAVQPLGKSRKTHGLIQMPEDAFNTGRIIHLGPECAKLEIGQTVCFGTKREEVKVNGDRLLIMEFDNIYGILNGETNEDSKKSK